VRRLFLLASVVAVAAALNGSSAGAARGSQAVALNGSSAFANFNCVATARNGEEDICP
jgi:hypothetical protein